MMRRKRMGSWVLMSGLLLIGPGAQAIVEEDGQTAVAGVLDGKVFMGEIGNKGKAHGDPDEFHFSAGTFRSTACDPYGFGDGTYTTAIQGDAITFEAKTLSSTDGKIAWRGTVHGDTLEGTAAWYKTEGSTPDELWFKGSLKP